LIDIFPFIDFYIDGLNDWSYNSVNIVYISTYYITIIGGELMKKLLHWNINQRHHIDTPAIVKEEILSQNADIIVLTEFFKTPNYDTALVGPLKDCVYHIFLDPRPAKPSIRQVLIAIRSEMIKNRQIITTYLPDNEGNIMHGKYPNFLRIDVDIDSVPVSVIGTRIRVWDSKGEEEQRRRKKQFVSLLQSIPNDRKLIMMGDFNISDHERFKKSDSKWHFEKDYKEELDKKHLKLHIPKNGYSPLHLEYQFDHLVTSDDIKVDNIAYFHKPSWPSGDNYPDHAILLADVHFTM
jgi:exonuclease III